ncbi:hypothetical protein PQR75_41950 [Paraburkholderia fungorum]|uniref:hypothetical protein n=1 Tax=Paraburkholderia fungorum TaxID=134537 RepID=UPI0038B72D04
MKVTERLNPPEIRGISMASVKKPSSGNWNATETKVLAEKNRSDAKLRTAMTRTRNPSNPATSAGTSGVADR